jgi:hypothetical protein
MPSGNHLQNVCVQKHSDIRCKFYKTATKRTSGFTHVSNRLIKPIQSIDVAAAVQEELYGLFARTRKRCDHEHIISVLRDKVHRVGTILVVDK